MPDRIIFPEWRDEFGSNHYPFADTATPVTAGNALELGLETFLDASLYPIGGGARVYLSQIEISSLGVTMSLSDEDSNDLGSVTFDALNPPDLLRFTDSRGRPAGVIITDQDQMLRFSVWPRGVHTFNLADAEFVASCVIPTPEVGVRGLLTAADVLFAGDVWLVGDNGVVLREEDGHIRIDIVGDPLFVRKLCGRVELFTPPNFIRTVNGCPPDPYGNFNLTVGDHLNSQTIMRIYPTEDGLVISAVGQAVRQE